MNFKHIYWKYLWLLVQCNSITFKHIYLKACKWCIGVLGTHCKVTFSRKTMNGRCLAVLNCQTLRINIEWGVVRLSTNFPKWLADSFSFSQYQGSHGFSVVNQHQNRPYYSGVTKRRAKGIRDLQHSELISTVRHISVGKHNLTISTVVGLGDPSVAWRTLVMFVGAATNSGWNLCWGNVPPSWLFIIHN